MEETIKAKKWCWYYGIRIYPFPLNNKGTKLAIVVEKDGEEIYGQSIYTNDNVYIKINELYLKYFNENK